MLAISLMTETDTRFATELTTEEEWGYLEEDFRRLMHFEPRGCFVAWKDKERVGIVTTTSYGDYAFLGSLIVRKEDRGRGIGETLLNHAVGYLMARGTKTMELDGVFPAASLYRRLGFRDKFLSLRFKGEGRKHRQEVSAYRLEMADRIVSFDREKTGLSRERIVRKLLDEFGDSVYVMERKRIVAYAIVRPRRGGHLTVGPWIADNEKVAGLLLRSIIGNYKGRILNIGVPETNRGAVRMVLNEGFYYIEPSLRMYLGDERDYERNVYGIIAPEKG